ncbi:MAG: parallel beta-helix domain-containing protein [Balneolaceae bacterium]|nr:parallel beta-helix domain-containing protein [Balneolaceae bacterium]
MLYEVGTEWSGEPSSDNGAYGLYPVNSSDILIENCYAYGASDAGIYVGQSDKAIVRNSTATGNVAGIQIENTTNADVYGNTVRDNAAGIMVFDLPDLSQYGGRTRVFNNTIIDNIRGNFSAPGGIVAEVPAGTGILVMSTSEVEIFDNTLEGNNVMGTAIASYAALVALGLRGAIQDPNYNPYPGSIYVHGNSYSKCNTYPDAAEQSTFGNMLVGSFGSNPIPEYSVGWYFYAGWRSIGCDLY